MPYVRYLGNARVLSAFILIDSAILFVFNVRLVPAGSVWLILLISTGQAVALMLGIALFLQYIPGLWKVLIEPAQLRWIIPKCSLLIVGSYLVAQYYFGVVIKSVASIDPPHYKSFDLSGTVIGSIMYVGWTFIWSLTAMILMYCLSVALMMAVFRCLQIFILRVAEHEKGPVLAVSALLTTIVVALKLMVGK